MSIPEKKYMVDRYGRKYEFDDLGELIEFTLDEFFHDEKDVKIASTNILFKEKKEENDLSVDSVKRFLDDQDGEICIKSDNCSGICFIWTREGYKAMIDERNALMEEDAKDLYDDQYICTFDGTRIQGKKQRV